MSNYYQLSTGRVAHVEDDDDFPALCNALNEPNGLLAIGGSLNALRLLKAYKQGIFPWFSAGDPIMWWSPNPRMVLFPNELKITSSLKKILSKPIFELRLNTSFRQVIQACASTKRPEQSGTWITDSIINAYCELHNKGYAISAECWLNNELVGGCYGVKIGHMFYGESMFHYVPNASKVAFIYLVNHLKSQHVAMIDCQMKTPLLSSFGGREITRDEFIEILDSLIKL